METPFIAEALEAPQMRGIAETPSAWRTPQGSAQFQPSLALGRGLPGAAHARSAGWALVSLGERLRLGRCALWGLRFARGLP